MDRHWLVAALHYLRRGRTYVGLVRITKVEKVLAVGEFDENRKGPGAPPRRGDVVYAER